MLKAGIVGAGNIATNRHVPAIRSRDDVKLSAVYTERTDPNFPSETKVVRSISELCQHVDIVHICSPPWVHVEQAQTALEHDVAVLSEKPMATSLSDARQLKKTVSESDSVYGVVHNFLFTHAMQRFKKIVGDTITSAHAVQYATTEFNIERHSTEWFDRLPGGMFWDEAPHMVYILRDLLGELKAGDAGASGGTVGPQTYSDLHASLQSGYERASITMRHAQPITEWWVVASTPSKTVAMDIFRGMVVEIPGDSKFERFARIPRLVLTGAMELATASVRYLWDRRQYPMPPAGFPELYDQFLIAVKNNDVDPPATAADGLSTIKILNDIATEAEFQV